MYGAILNRQEKRFKNRRVYKNSKSIYGRARVKATGMFGWLAQKKVARYIRETYGKNIVIEYHEFITQYGATPKAITEDTIESFKSDLLKTIEKIKHTKEDIERLKVEILKKGKK